MIIRKLSLHHFLTYYGDQRLEFPCQEANTLTVIVGPNNSGKTSLIRALKFWFYGEQGVPNRANLADYLNNKAKGETEIGKGLEGWVEVTFDHETNQGRQTTCLRRTLEIKRLGPERWEMRSVSLRQILPGARLEQNAETEATWQRLLEGLMPKPLFDAFYFKGEPLDGKLLGDVSSIRQALGLFLHEDQWKEAEEATLAIRQRIDRKLADVLAKDAELQQATQASNDLQDKLENQQKALQEARERQADLEAREAEETENLAKLGDEAAVQQAKQLFERARHREQQAADRLAKTNLEIAQAIGASSGLPFLRGAVAPVREILAEMERENLLPADISEGFIDRVLTRPKCICGHPHDSGTRAAWEDYRKKTLAADVNEALTRLLDWVKPDGPLSVERRAAASVDEINRLLKARQDAVEQSNGSRADRQQAENVLLAMPHEEILRIGKTLRQLGTDLRETGRCISTLERAVSATDHAWKKQKDTVKTLSSRAGVNHAELRNLQAARERADCLHRALTQCRASLDRYFHQALQTGVSASYDSKATDGSRAHIDRRTLLPSIHVRGQKTNNLGGGQSQLLALAYVVALARLRQNMHLQMERLGVRLGKISDLSFFMDSPLGNMEQHYKQAAAALAPGSAKQVVMLLWKEDWEFTRPILEAEADTIFALDFHTRAEDVAKLPPEARTYGFVTGPRPLIEALPPEDEYPRSEIVRIK